MDLITAQSITSKADQNLVSQSSPLSIQCDSLVVRMWATFVLATNKVNIKNTFKQINKNNERTTFPPLNVNLELVLITPLLLIYELVENLLESVIAIMTISK